MKTRASAFTLVELLVVIAIIAILAALLLPVLNQAVARAKRAQCINNLRENGIGFQEFAHEHNGLFPMSVPVSAGGTMELDQNGIRLLGEFYFAYRNFQVLSNDLATPKLLVCPADDRVPAVWFASLQNSNLSYFVGVNADYAKPTSILAGDRNITNDWIGTATLQQLGPNHYLRWTRELHHFKGDLLFSDGHVEERNSASLYAAANQSPETAAFFVPTVAGGGGGAATNSGGRGGGTSGGWVGGGLPSGWGNNQGGSAAPPNPGGNGANPGPGPAQPANPPIPSTPSEPAKPTPLPRTTNAPPTMKAAEIPVVAPEPEVATPMSTAVVEPPVKVGYWPIYLLLLLLLLLAAAEAYRRAQAKRKRALRLQAASAQRRADDPYAKPR